MNKKFIYVRRYTGKGYTTIHGRQTLHARCNPYDVAIDDELGLSLDDIEAAPQAGNSQQNSSKSCVINEIGWGRPKSLENVP
jgi:outer membrane receptor for Fe3+-dicitrate